MGNNFRSWMIIFESTGRTRGQRRHQNWERERAKRGGLEFPHRCPLHSHFPSCTMRHKLNRNSSLKLMEGLLCLGDKHGTQDHRPDLEKYRSQKEEKCREVNVISSLRFPLEAFYQLLNWVCMEQLAKKHYRKHLWRWYKAIQKFQKSHGAGKTQFRM